MKSNHPQIGAYMGARLRQRRCVDCDRRMVLSVSPKRQRIRCFGCSPVSHGSQATFTPELRICAQCAIGFIAERPSGRFCSAKCRNRHDNKKKQMAARDRTPRPCKQCARQFTPTYGHLLQVYCSHACRRAFANARSTGNTHRRRAKKYGGRYEHFDPKLVFERDSWTCRICGVGTTGAPGTPTAPELDHIKPMSVGGDHTPANTQCACRSCNQRKGAKMEANHA